MQFLLNTLSVFAILFLTALSFFLIYKPTRIFHLSHAFVIVLGGYLVLLFREPMGLVVAISSSLLLCAAFGVLNEWLFYAPLREGKQARLKMLILSLGVYIVGQNILSVVFSDDITILAIGPVSTGYELWGGYITNAQIVMIVVAILIALLTFVLWRKTPFGKAIRAISINAELAQIFGIPRRRIILCAFAIGSAIGGTVGILIGYDTGLTPAMGFSLLLSGIVVMIIGGTENLWGLLIGAAILAIAQNITSYYWDSKWVDAVTYMILILFLLIRPYGVSGQKNRKVEV